MHDAWLQFWRAIAECRIAGFANLNSCTATCPSTEENLYHCPGNRAAVQKIPQALSLHCQHCWKVTSLCWPVRNLWCRECSLLKWLPLSIVPEGQPGYVQPARNHSRQSFRLCSRRHGCVHRESIFLPGVCSNLRTPYDIANQKRDAVELLPNHYRPMLLFRTSPPRQASFHPLDSRPDVLHPTRDGSRTPMPVRLRTPCRLSPVGSEADPIDGE
jgi:hypothetical protein